MSKYQTISTMQWEGIQSQKFKGNRSHTCVPQNQLNFKLECSHPYYHQTGKKHFQQKPSQCCQQPFKKHLKTFQNHYKSNILNFPPQTKLIKLHGLSERKTNQTSLRKDMNPKKESWQFLGMSKMKALQKGQKQTGIYRNFYKSIQNTTFKPHTKSSKLYPSQLYQLNDCKYP